MTEDQAPIIRPSVDLLPPLPSDDWGVPDGYEWISQLSATGWYAVGLWGADGWDLGSWPYQIVAHCDLPALGVFGLVTYTEGDLDVSAFSSREERDAETNQVAVSWWISNENGPSGLTPDMSPIPIRYSGPYRD
ncbi:hypothetical protein ACWDBO_44910 [Streptomyces mirabilis]|uniref:hypothetical protein n=1 Tax=Streptomyces mirabilis TaxID=68239 RepID=UPI003329DE6C